MTRDDAAEVIVDAIFSAIKETQRELLEDLRDRIEAMPVATSGQIMKGDVIALLVKTLNESERAL